MILITIIFSEADLRSPRYVLEVLGLNVLSAEGMSKFEKDKSIHCMIADKMIIPYYESIRKFDEKAVMKCPDYWLSNPVTDFSEVCLRDLI